MKSILEQLEKLNRIAEEYPVKIPLKVAADFLGMNEESLKAALMRGNVPFGFGYQRHDEANRVMIIPTLPFYLWLTNSNAQMVMHVHKGGELV